MVRSINFIALFVFFFFSCEGIFWALPILASQQYTGKHFFSQSCKNVRTCFSIATRPVFPNLGVAGSHKS